MWEPLDFNDMTDDEKRLAAHPQVAWIIVSLMLVAGALGIFL